MSRKSTSHIITFCLLVLAVTIGAPATAQNTYETLGSPNYWLIDRTYILQAPEVPLHTAIKPYRRSDVAEISAIAITAAPSAVSEQRYLRALKDNNEFLVPQIRENNDRYVDSIIYNEAEQTFIIEYGEAITEPYSLAAKTPLFKTFYKTPAHLFEFTTKDFYLKINPLLDFGFGKEFDDDGFLFRNRRGLELRGGVDGKVFFQTNFIETQIRPASNIRWWESRFRSIPQAGLYKDFESSVLNFDDGFDYLIAEGYVGFNLTKHIGVHFGHGQNFIGDGYRSMFMSDFGKNYFYLKLNTRVWKFHYQNIFAELAARDKVESGTVAPKKWMAAHYLSFYPKKNISLSLFEAVIFDRENNQFELQYLNPIILYRTIEHHLGSPDNVLLGFSARWDIWSRVSLYGQIIFDEFKFSELTGGNGWWGNKFAFQTGVKYINAFGVDQLDLQVEYNQARPFTYSHTDSIGSYSNYHQPLSHAMGANFQEAIGIVRYMPVDRLEIEGKLFLVNTAEDTDSVFYGTNILRPNSERNADYGIKQGQGVGVNNIMLSLDVRYMLKHNFYIEARYFRRDYDSVDDNRDLLTHYVSLGLRWNLFRGQTEF